jgi:DNA (cytosine-5)-methyltransferase 1
MTVLNRHKPRWFLAENVEGLLHRDKGHIFNQIFGELADAGNGYVLTPHLYRFEQYGVPQCLARLVIVGISKDDDEQGVTFKVPAPTTAGNPRTAAWAMEHEACRPDILKPVAADAPNNIPRPITERVRKRLEHTAPGENAWNADIPSEYRLKVKNAHLSMIYRRLHPDAPSYTITGNGGGGTHGYHWEEARALTNRERARLQSFPDLFAFYGGEESVRRQIGMAVPPVAAKIIFEAILKSYAGIEYPSVEATIGNTAQRRLDAMFSSKQNGRRPHEPVVLAV